MRMFNLVRDEDESGVSGVGTVAEGVEFSDGTCAMRWHTKNPDKATSTAFYDNAADLIAIHGHQGKTHIEYEGEKPKAVSPQRLTDLMCPRCKHLVHEQGECMERVCDSAGDIDYCPCY